MLMYSDTQSLTCHVHSILMYTTLTISEFSSVVFKNTFTVNVHLWVHGDVHPKEQPNGLVRFGAPWFRRGCWEHEVPSPRDAIVLAHHGDANVTRPKR